jgi:hypothetical protein
LWCQGSFVNLISIKDSNDETQPVTHYYHTLNDGSFVVLQLIFTMLLCCFTYLQLQQPILFYIMLLFSFNRCTFQPFRGMLSFLHCTCLLHAPWIAFKVSSDRLLTLQLHHYCSAVAFTPYFMKSIPLYFCLLYISICWPISTTDIPN